MSELVSLAKAYEKYFKIGAAVCPMCIQKHHDLILRHFSSVTPENEMKYESIEPEEEIFYFLHRCLSNMTDFFPFCLLLIRMYFVCHCSHYMSNVAIWLIKTSLFKLFNHHLALNIQTVLIETQRKHAVAL